MELDLLFPLHSLGSVKRQKDIFPCTVIRCTNLLRTNKAFYVFSREDIMLQNHQFEPSTHKRKQ